MSKDIKPSSAQEQLEDYLKRNLKLNIISFVIATHDFKKGDHWYIHPNGQPGETLDLYFDKAKEQESLVEKSESELFAIANDYLNKEQRSAPAEKGLKKLSVQFEEFPDVECICSLNEFLGMVTSGKTKAEAWQEMMKSIGVLIAHNSGISSDELTQLQSPSKPAEPKKEQEGGWQLCPKCNGHGAVTRPPYIPGDVQEWVSSAAVFTCDVCNGAKVIARPQPMEAEVQKEIDRLRTGIKSFIGWLKEKRPHITGAGAPISMLQELLDGATPIPEDTKSDAVEFAEWINDNFYFYTRNHFESDKRWQQMEYKGKFEEGPELTSAELYQLFLKEKSEPLKNQQP